VGRKKTVAPVAQLSIGLGADQWQAVEAYRAARRLSSASEAVRALIWRGLEAEGAAPPPEPPAPAPRPRPKRKAD